MNAYETQRDRLMEVVAAAKNQRIRPNEVKQQVAKEFNISVYQVNEMIKDLIEQEELVYAYRDPCSYVEIPCNGCDGGHRAARAMKVVMDARGNPWLCDDTVQHVEGLENLACWDCGELAFTRS